MDFSRPEFFKKHRLLAYLGAVVAVSFALLVGSLLWRAVDRPASAPLFIAAIVFSTMIGGIRVGLFATVLSGIVLEYFFIPPFYTFDWSRDEVVRLTFFIAEGGFMSWIAEKLRNATEDLRSSREELRQLTAHQQSLREEEQKRIAREIHDELGQALTGLKLELHLLRKAAATVDGVRELSTGLEGLSGRIDDTIGTVRRISSEIRPSILDDFGLVAAIEWEASEFERKSGVVCTVTSNSDNIEIAPASANAVLRIVQEALTNVARHAKASRVIVRILWNGPDVTVSIDDDGRGVTAEKVKQARSLGFIGMRERARLVGGSIEIRPRPPGGTTVEVLVPITEPRAALAS
jgi:signal transduction histidine kinase